MRIGIDFGTTRIVVAAEDRGNYPVLKFESPDGTAHDYIPSVVAARDGEMRFGWKALAVAGDEGWTLTRSVKRLLDQAGPSTAVDLGAGPVGLLDVLAAMARDLHEQLDASSASVVIGVPANANSNQRYLTIEAFRRAGFTVLGLVNEPSAAGIEYAHALARKPTADQLLLVYDLGGGTFDAALVEIRDHEHEVLATESLANLGGDDFDAALAGLLVDDELFESLTAQERYLLAELCRELKEALNPMTRRIQADLDVVRDGLGMRTTPVADYYDRCRELIEQSLICVDSLLETAAGRAADCLYVTGGASELPLVSRMLRERFGRKVKRSAHTRSATAIGAAICAASGGAARTVRMRDKLTRHFGVWRESDGGREIIFDPVFERGLTLPEPGAPPHVVRRAYQPAHNVGHFRYLEASATSADGRPSGDIALWDDVRFPFDPSLELVANLERIPVERSARASACHIEEIWRADSNGQVSVEIRNLTSGYARVFSLAQWTEKHAGPSARRSAKNKENG